MLRSMFAVAITRLGLVAVLTAACAQAPASAPSAPATTAAATTPAASPTSGTDEFMTSEGFWTLGKPDAKVLFVDSSDFG